jgi:hypothetical protein
MLFSLAMSGCVNTNLAFEMPWSSNPPATPVVIEEETEEVCAVEEAEADAAQAQLFRRAETERAEQLVREIARLQADLKTAESALVEAESGMSGSHTRADAISSLAVTRIQVERAASRAPWRQTDIQGARAKLVEAERQVDEGRFGAAIFFVYRARRVAESVLDEAHQVTEAGNARLIRSKRVNLRAGPSTGERVLSVLEAGTPVITQANEGDWMLVQVTGGPSGWIHRRLVGGLVSELDGLPAAPQP